MRKVVFLGGGGLHAEALLGSLGASGLEGVEAATADEARIIVENGAVGVIIAAADEGRQGLIRSLPTALRRGCVLIVVEGREARNAAMDAFRLGADLVIGSHECTRIGDIMAAALATKRVLVAPLDPGAASRLGG